jgi:hypothetical protein
MAVPALSPPKQVIPDIHNMLWPHPRSDTNI